MILKRWLVGLPLKTKEAAHERLSKRLALAVFSSDALSSVAYATEEILLVLTLAGTAMVGYSIPLSLSIIGLLILSWIANRYQLWIDSPPDSNFTSEMLRNLGPWFVTTFIIWYLLNFIPNTRVRFKSAVIGAVVGTALWMFANWNFAQFLDTAFISGPQSVMYARFAVLPLLLLWLFVGWSILLFSSQLAYAHQNMDKLIWDRTHPYLSPMFYESLALKVMLRITSQYFHHGRSSSEEIISAYPRM